MERTPILEGSFSLSYETWNSWFFITLEFCMKKDEVRKVLVPVLATAGMAGLKVLIEILKAILENDSKTMDTK